MAFPDSAVRRATAAQRVNVLPGELTVRLRSYGRMTEDRREAALSSVEVPGSAGKLDLLMNPSIQPK